MRRVDEMNRKILFVRTLKRLNAERKMTSKNPLSKSFFDPEKLKDSLSEKNIIALFPFFSDREKAEKQMYEMGEG